MPEVERYRGCCSIFLCVFFFPLGILFWFYPIDQVVVKNRPSRKTYELVEV